jgi:epoxyqueuosine reductase QueG
MGIADVVGSIGSTATGVADKAKSISEVGNLKRKIAYEEERIVEIFADIGPSVDRLLAYRAGLGFYGKNKMLINPDFGSYFFIGYILCDIELESDASIERECDGCGKCIKACPGSALDDSFCIEKCASHISQKKGELTQEEIEILKKSSLIFGCDICQRVCPHNNITPRPMAEFTEDIISSLSKSDLEGLSNKEFMNKYKDRAFSWRGKKVLERNIDILGKP